MNGNYMIENDERENLSGCDDFEEWVASHEQAYIEGKMNSADCQIRAAGSCTSTLGELQHEQRH